MFSRLSNNACLQYGKYKTVDSLFTIKFPLTWANTDYATVYVTKGTYNIAVMLGPDDGTPKYSVTETKGWIWHKENGVIMWLAVGMI